MFYDDADVLRVCWCLRWCWFYADADDYADYCADVDVYADADDCADAFYQVGLAFCSLYTLTYRTCLLVFPFSIVGMWSAHRYACTHRYVRMFTSMPIGIPLICYLLYASATKCKNWHLGPTRPPISYVGTLTVRISVHQSKTISIMLRTLLALPGKTFMLSSTSPTTRGEISSTGTGGAAYSLKSQDAPEVMWASISSNQNQSESVITNSLSPKVNVKIWANFYFLVRTKYVLKCKFGKISQIIP